MGPGIPGIIVSPLVQEGSVYSKLLDHTSILQFLSEKFTGQPFSPTVEQRRQNGVHSLSDVLSVQPHREAPPCPTVQIDVQTALGKYIDVSQATDMEQSFSNSAEQMLQQHPDETAAATRN